MNPNTDLCHNYGTPMAIGHYCPHHNPNDDFDYMDDIWNDCKE